MQDLLFLKYFAFNRSKLVFDEIGQWWVWVFNSIWIWIFFFFQNISIFCLFKIIIVEIKLNLKLKSKEKAEKVLKIILTISNKTKKQQNKKNHEFLFNFLIFFFEYSLIRKAWSHPTLVCRSNLLACRLPFFWCQFQVFILLIKFCASFPHVPLIFPLQTPQESYCAPPKRTPETKNFCFFINTQFCYDRISNFFEPFFLCVP